MQARCIYNGAITSITKRALHNAIVECVTRRPCQDGKCNAVGSATRRFAPGSSIAWRGKAWPAACDWAGWDPPGAILGDCAHVVAILGPSQSLGLRLPRRYFGTCLADSSRGHLGPFGGPCKALAVQSWRVGEPSLSLLSSGLPLSFPEPPNSPKRA